MYVSSPIWRGLYRCLIGCGNPGLAWYKSHAFYLIYKPNYHYEEIIANCIIGGATYILRCLINENSPC